MSRHDWAPIPVGDYDVIVVRPSALSSTWHVAVADRKTACGKTMQSGAEYRVLALSSLAPTGTCAKCGARTPDWGHA